MIRFGKPRLNAVERALMERAEREVAACTPVDAEAGMHAVMAASRFREHCVVYEIAQASRRAETARPRGLPRWAIRLVPALAAGMAAVVLIGIAAGGRQRAGVQQACGGADEQTQVVIDRGRCVELTGTNRVAFGTDQSILSLQEQIYAENEVARQRWAGHHDRPIVTFVYLTSFTPPEDDNDDSLVAEREGLRGLAYAQTRANLTAEAGLTSPYLQILLANAGADEADTNQTVSRILDRFAEDRQIMAVVAAIDSRTEPVKALQRLCDAGLPVISPTLAADGLDDQLGLFLQLAAPASVQADLVHHYSTRVLRLNSLINYYTYGRPAVSDLDNDLYVNSLRTDLARQFGSSNYQEHFWSAGTSLTAACRKNSVVFFGGRYTEFGDFARQIYRDCEGRMPALVAAGSTAQYLANPAARATAPADLAVAFVSGGYLGTCAVISEPGLAVAKRHTERQNYLAELGDECHRDPAGQAAGWSALTYDAARLLTQAIQAYAATFGAAAELRPWQAGSMAPSSLYQSLRHWDTDRPYYGVTGPISFDSATRYAAMVCAPSVQRAYRTSANTPRLVDSVGVTYVTDPRPSGKPCRPQ